ncbi:MAG: DPP IV N-terminal domain-containing protein [Acidobacteriota bacterium]
MRAMLPILALLSLAPTTAAEPGSEEGFLRQYAETFRFRLGHPASIEITPKGDAVLFLRSPARSFVRDLYLFDPATGEERRLLTAEEVLGGGEEELTAEEKARRERMRLAARGFASFSLSGDGERLLTPLSGRLFLVQWRTGDVRELKVEGGFPIDPRFSPDGQHVAYSAGGDLYTIHIESGDVRRLTTRDGEHVANGVPEFVAQEEMDRDHGYWFSPDGQHLAYQRNDDAALPTFYIADPADPAKAPQAWRYPRAGTVNTDVQLGVIPVGGGDTTWIQWDREAFPYLATVRWQKNAPLTILVQDRRQQDQRLLAVDPKSGKTTELLRETDAAWLNLDQDMPRWLPGGEHFLWTTERRGFWQLELRRADGSLERELTPTSWIYRSFVHYDPKTRTAMVSGGSGPLDIGLYSVALEPGSAPTAWREEPGVWSGTLSADGTLRALTHLYESGRAFPVYRGDEKVGELTSVAEEPSVSPRLERIEVGDAPIHGEIQRPKDFDPAKKYPVILHVYGGPHRQMVSRSGDDSLLDQWFADQGFIVVTFDGRGTPGRGRGWEREIRSNLIDAPLFDQTDALLSLGELYPEMDLERVGVYGWSFGGYFSAMAVMRRPDVFDAAVAGAPVCDWQEYDTHYTERYLGLPQEDPEAYTVSNVTTYAEKLDKPLLIIHGTADDNVYFVHGLKMSNSLFEAGKNHDFLTLSGQTHMVTEPTVVERMYGRMIDHFKAHLGEPESTEN